MFARLDPRAAVLAGIAALSLAAAGPAAAAPPDTSTQAADATVASTLTATLPSAAMTFNLGPGSASAPTQAVNVRSNDAWGLEISADSSWLVNSQGVPLSDPLKVAVGGSPVAVPNEPALFKSLTAADAQAAGDSGTDVGVNFSQAFSYSDAPGAYHSTITYTVTNSLD